MQEAGSSRARPFRSAIGKRNMTRPKTPRRLPLISAASTRASSSSRRTPWRSSPIFPPSSTSPSPTRRKSRPISCRGWRARGDGRAHRRRRRRSLRRLQQSRRRARHSAPAQRPAAPGAGRAFPAITAAVPRRLAKTAAASFRPVRGRAPPARSFTSSPRCCNSTSAGNMTSGAALAGHRRPHSSGRAADDAARPRA